MTPVTLDHLQEGDWTSLNRVVDTLRSLVLDTGGRSLGVRVGVDTGVVFTASTSSAVRTVTHGLGRVPVAVLATNNSGTVAGSGITMSTGAFSATTFAAVGFFPSALTGTFPFFWVAIG